ncbi:class I SAM-dependent methyltransferase [Achromobacter seleniivolatilans]|uniref:Class I SAM-dependent methyltransferase n=1 Tax=Achromobacter seleniivolatilans TaxID=3047478 RepID=A0ABY9LZ08_9BURK|nr:class I SAM-dependent methyltransferase [Achromobacter sp. R39]WMD19707.1 class I SAM-dependent methyltransferase [Achromobacter sp. R39]
MANPYLEKSPMSKKTHWEHVHQVKGSDTASWYTPHLTRSLGLMKQTGLSETAAIIDVGAGQSTLVDDMLDLGYKDLSVLDISEAAISASATRIGRRAANVQWLVGDVTTVDLPGGRYDIWHDRAVFHFLMESNDRRAYVAQLTHALRPSGFAIIATFGLEGPLKCSGLDTMRYDASSLSSEIGPAFELVKSVSEMHETPSGARQQFEYCLFRML